MASTVRVEGEGGKALTLWCHPDTNITRIERTVAMEWDVDYFMTIPLGELVGCSLHKDLMSRDVLERFAEALVERQGETTI